MMPAGDDEAAGEENTLSAGEFGAADSVAGGLTGVEVFVGEIPAEDETTKMLWTARCSDPSHDLLGHFRTRDDAEAARAEHLKSAHGGAST